MLIHVVEQNDGTAAIQVGTVSDMAPSSLSQEAPDEHA